MNRWERTKYDRNTINVNGSEREFFTFPKKKETLNNVKRPAIVILHGLCGTALGSAKATQYAFETEANKHRFLVVYPTGEGKNWGLGDCGDRPNAPNDIQFFNRLLDQLVASLAVDHEKIYIVGLSRGAQAIFHLSCALHERIAAIAPICMLLPSELENEFTQMPPLPIALINGTNDRLVKQTGGDVILFGRKYGNVISTEKTIEALLNRNCCSASEPKTTRLNTKDDDTSVLQRTWCEGAQNSVVHYLVEGGGHRWPDAKDNILLRYTVGKTTREIHLARDIWNFFSDKKLFP